MRSPSEQENGAHERLNPFCFPGHPEALRHVSRYLWATKWLRETDVVHDRACGYGYGSFILSHVTFSGNVVGFDHDEDAIIWARQMYGRPGRLQFEIADICQIKTSADVIVSFETLEHISNWEVAFSLAVEQSELFIFSVPYMQARTSHTYHRAFGFCESSFDHLLSGKVLRPCLQKPDGWIVPWSDRRTIDDFGPSACFIGVIQ